MRDDRPICLPPEHLLRALRRPRWFQLRVLKAKENSAYYRKAFADLKPITMDRS